MSKQSNITQNNSSLKCHICNISIPKPFILDHMSSFLHNTNSQLIDMALEKSKDHIKFNYPLYFDTNCDTDEDFCDICNVSYSFIHKLKHKTSERHKKLSVYEKILPKILILVNNVTTNLDVIDKIKYILTEDDKEVVNSKIVTTKDNNNHIKLPNGTELNKEKPYNCDMVHCEVCKVCKTPAAYADHIKSYKHKKKLRELNISERESPESIIDVEQTYCDICDVYKNTISFDAHCKGSKHLKRLYKRVLTTNHHSTYIIDGIHGGKHCKICSIDINSAKTEEHLSSDDHLDMYKMLLQYYNIIKVGDDYFCPGCDIFDTDIIKHISVKHSNLFLFNCSFCPICRIKVPIVNMKLHNQGRLHANNLNNMKKKDKKPFKHIDIQIEDDEVKKAVTIDSFGLKCRFCDVIFYEYSTILKHIKSDKHVFKVQSKRDRL